MGVLFLVGPRGSGKSRAAGILESRHGCRSVDTDALILAKTGKSIADIVASEGWPAFREHEKEALRNAHALAALPGGRFGVVATGGGIVLDASNRVFMRENGCVAYLAASPETLIDRLANARDVANRPALSELSFEEETRAVLKAREPLYREAAHHCIDAALPADTVARMLYETMIFGGGLI